MRVVVTGATGNIGTAVVRWLVDHPAVGSVAGIARRIPAESSVPAGARVTWHSIDIADPTARDRLTDIFDGAGAVVHLAWQITADHDRHRQRYTNRDGSAAVVEAVRRAGARHLTFLSSAAVYSPAPSDIRVREDWPRRGIPGSPYSADKVAVEDMLDRVQEQVPGLRVARVRPPTVLQTAAARELTRMTLGRLAPLARLTRGRLPLLPLPSRTRTQVVAAEDVADLVGRAVLADASGAYNVADEPVLTAADVARLLGGWHVPAPTLAARMLLGVTFRLGLQRVEPAWADVLLGTPILDCTRAIKELGWRGTQDGRTLLASMRAAVAAGTGAPTPPL